MEFQAAKVRLVKRTPFAIAVAGDEVESEVEVEGGEDDDRAMAEVRFVIRLGSLI